jgi:hypothetical protein
MSVLVELTCACLILNSLTSLTSFPSVCVGLFGGKAQGLVWAPVVTRRWSLQICRMLPVRICNKMASSGMGMEEQEIKHWVLTVLTGLALAGQEGHCSSTLTHTMTTMVGTEL